MSPVFFRRDNLSLSSFSSAHFLFLFSCSVHSPSIFSCLTKTSFDRDRNQASAVFISFSLSWYFIFWPPFLVSKRLLMFCQRTAVYQHFALLLHGVALSRNNSFLFFFFSKVFHMEIKKGNNRGVRRQMLNQIDSVQRGANGECIEQNQMNKWVSSCFLKPLTKSSQSGSRGREFPALGATTLKAQPRLVSNRKRGIRQEALFMWPQPPTGSIWVQCFF